MGIQAAGLAAQNAGWQLAILDQLKLRGVAVSRGAYETLEHQYRKGSPKPWGAAKTKHPLPTLDDHDLIQIAGKAPGLNRALYENLL